MKYLKSLFFPLLKNFNYFFKFSISWIDKNIELNMLLKEIVQFMFSQKKTLKQIKKGTNLLLKNINDQH